MVEALFSALCHQMAERSPGTGATAFPLCYRCAGLYVGLISAYVMLGTVRSRRPSGVDRPLAAALAVCTLPLLVDGWGNMLQLWASPDFVRAGTGMGVGAALPLLLAMTHARGGPSRARCVMALAGSLVMAGVAILVIDSEASPSFTAAMSYAAVLGLIAFVADLAIVVFLRETPAYAKRRPQPVQNFLSG